jgi:hypothetical protein
MTSRTGRGGYRDRGFWRSGDRPERTSMRRALEVRARRILGGGGGGRGDGGAPPPVIVKAISSARSVRAVRAVVRYVTRTRKSDLAAGGPPPRVLDEAGSPMPPGSGVELLRGWELVPDEDNLRPAARAEGLSGRRVLSAYGEAATFRRIQALHFCISVTKPDGMDAREASLRLEAAVSAMLRATFGLWGHRAIVAVHEDTGHLHAHAVVSMAGRDGLGDRRRLPSGARDGSLLDALRAEFAATARLVGLPSEATRVVDRPEAWRDGRPPATAEAGDPDLRGGTGVRRLAAAAPEWWATHCEDVVRRMAERHRRRLAGSAASDRRASAPAAAAGGATAEPPAWIAADARWRRLYERLSEMRVFSGPGDALGRALSSFRDMRDEEAAVRRAAGRAPASPRSSWWLLRQPVAFGPVADGPSRAHRDLELVRLVRGLPPPEPSRPRPRPPSLPSGTAERHLEVAVGLVRLRRALFEQRRRDRSLADLVAGLRSASEGEAAGRGAAGRDDARGGDRSAELARLAAAVEARVARLKGGGAGGGGREAARPGTPREEPVRADRGRGGGREDR